MLQHDFLNDICELAKGFGRASALGDFDSGQRHCGGSAVRGKGGWRLVVQVRCDAFVRLHRTIMVSECRSKLGKLRIQRRQYTFIIDAHSGKPGFGLMSCLKCNRVQSMSSCQWHVEV